ncbi:MAG: GNAT family N-acetyltransferase [Ilumatobacter sp.]|nr:GNAT family N-acetyltransferase [Ilumatobacter sp.]
MHLADRFVLPEGYVARPYAGRSDHAAMAAMLTEYRLITGDPEMVNADQMDQSYAHLTDCDPDLDIALVERDGELAAYCRPAHGDLDDTTDLIVFVPTSPAHLRADLFHALADGCEAHLRKWISDRPARYRGYACHPGPGVTPTDGEAAWLEQRGYTATEWGASLRRPDLDDIPDLPLPDGIEVRPVRPEQMRDIVAAHHECFRGEWDFSEIDERTFAHIIDDPYRDETLWQVAWDGDTIVGQVKPFINDDENTARGYRRGYTEYISTHRDYRNRGIAGALLARALAAIRDRGMTEAVLGVDTNNPGGAFQLYTKLGFELQTYEAVYTRPT